MRSLSSVPFWTLGVLIFAMPAALASAAQQSDWSLTLDATYNSKYIWRGINVVDDHVFQPSVTLGYKGLSANVWGNRDLTSINGNAGNFTEIDYTLDYSWSCGDAGFSVGAIYYDFPHSGGPSTTELYGSVGMDWPLAPTLAVYYDVDEADGAYLNLGVGHTFADVWTPSQDVAVSIDLGASVGFATSNYNRFYFGEDKSAFTDLLFSLGAPFAIGDRWTITPTVNFSQLLDDDIRDSTSDDTNVWGGVSLAYSF
ncbi:MAG: hypothetical protein ACOC7S_02350 [Planctomycetota bacterium]